MLVNSVRLVFEKADPMMRSKVKVEISRTQRKTPLILECSHQANTVAPNTSQELWKALLGICQALFEDRCHVLRKYGSVSKNNSWIILTIHDRNSSSIYVQTWSCHGVHIASNIEFVTRAATTNSGYLPSLAGLGRRINGRDLRLRTHEVGKNPQRHGGTGEAAALQHEPSERAALTALMASNLMRKEREQGSY